MRVLKNILPLLALFTSFLYLPYLMAQTPVVANSKFALVGGTLVDGSGAPPLENAILLINDGLIKPPVSWDV